jgi:hypothetical protein
MLSVRIKYTTVKDVDRKPAEIEIDIPAEMIYRLVHTIHNELQDPESVKNWEMIAMMFGRLIQHLQTQKQMSQYRPPFFAPGGGLSLGSVPVKNLNDVKKFIETAMGEIDERQKFDDIFQDDKTIPDELKKKKFKPVKAEEDKDIKDKDDKKDIA